MTKMIRPSPDSVRVTTKLFDTNILIISYDHYDYFDCNTMECLYNNNKIKYYCVSLHTRKWLKDQFEIVKEKIYNLDSWQSIGIRYIGHNVNSTKSNVNNKGKSYNIL